MCFAVCCTATPLTGNACFATNRKGDTLLRLVFPFVLYQAQSAYTSIISIIVP